MKTEKTNDDVENWTPPNLEPKDYDELLKIVKRMGKGNIPPSVLLTLYNPLIPYIYIKKTLRGKTKWKPHDKDGRKSFCSVAFVLLLSEEWDERTQRLAQNTFNQERLDRVMSKTPLLSPVKAEEIMQGIFDLAFPKEPKLPLSTFDNVI